MSAPFRIRPYNAATDMEFVWSTWIKSFQGSRAVVHVPPDVYYSEQRALITRFFRRGLKVLVACDPESEVVIYGWGAAAALQDILGAIVHYVYVKSDFRKGGMGKAIFAELSADVERSLAFADRPVRTFFTHWPPPMRREEGGAWLAERLEHEDKEKIAYNPWKAA